MVKIKSISCIIIPIIPHFLLKLFTQTFYSNFLLKLFTQTFYSNFLLKLFTQTFYSNFLLKLFIQNMPMLSKNTLNKFWIAQIFDTQIQINIPKTKAITLIIKTT
ncbi:hypothetical protein D6D94_08475 [Moraxella catarrhalis]|nr:hypothetical protein D6D94_08475 [Moraxella catarrhalis]